METEREIADAAMRAAKGKGTIRTPISVISERGSHPTLHVEDMAMKSTHPLSGQFEVAKRKPFAGAKLSFQHVGFMSALE